MYNRSNIIRKVYSFICLWAKVIIIYRRKKRKKKRIIISKNVIRINEGVYLNFHTHLMQLLSRNDYRPREQQVDRLSATFRGISLRNAFIIPGKLSTFFY